MIDYDNISTSEVQRLAKQGDKDALFEMAYRCPDSEGVHQMVWAAYWWGKAAGRGHVFAKRKYAGFLQTMPPSAKFIENRLKSMQLYNSIVKDFDDNKLEEDDRSVGMIAKIELGIMLCEGLGTPRDCVRGVELIKEGEESMKIFGGLKFTLLQTIGQLYGMGYAQEDEEPTINDLEISIKYLERAIADFKPDRDESQMLANAKEYLSHQRKHLTDKKSQEANLIGLPNELRRIREIEQRKSSIEYAKERREERSKPTEIGQQIDDFMHQLRENYRGY